MDVALGPSNPSKVVVAVDGAVERIDLPKEASGYGILEPVEAVRRLWGLQLRHEPLISSGRLAQLMDEGVSLIALTSHEPLPPWWKHDRVNPGSRILW